MAVSNEQPFFAPTLNYLSALSAKSAWLSSVTAWMGIGEMRQNQQGIINDYERIEVNMAMAVTSTPRKYQIHRNLPSSLPTRIPGYITAARLSPS